MNRKEVLADIIRAGPKAALQGNRETNNSMLSFATGRFSTNQSLQQARQMPMGAGDTFGSMAMPFSTDGSTGSFDTFSTNGFNPNQRQGNFNMNSANLNSATNFDTFGGGNFDTFGQKSAFGNFDSAALNSATNFDQFNSGFGQFASNGFDSASLNSATNFDSFVNSRNAQLQAQQGKQQQQQGNFDSFAISGFQDMPSSFDSFANDSFAGAPQKQLSPNDAFSSASNFDSFKSPMSFDSFAAGNSGVGFDTFSEELNKAKQQQQQQQQQPQQKQFVSPGGADLASARGFDTFGGGGNGFDSFAAGSNGFDSFAAGASGFDSFAGNGFDSAALNTGAGFDTFSENLNKAKEQQPQQQPPQQKQFVSPGGADLASAKGFDSFQGGGLDSFKGGFDSFKGSNGFDSFAAGSNGFDSFAGNGFDSAALNSGAGFDTFSENLNKAKNESNDQQKNFVSPKEADLASSNGLDSFALNSGSNFAKPGELNPSANFDSFAGGFNSPVDLNSGNFVKMNGNFDSGAFPSFDSFVASQSPLSNADLQPQPQQPTQQQEPPKAEQEPPKVEQNPEPKQEPPKPQEKSQPQQPVQQAQQQQQQPAERSHSPPPQPGQQGQPQMIIMQEQPKTQSQLSPQQIQMMRQAQMQKQQIIMQKQQQIASLNRIQQMQLMQQQQALQQQSIPGKPPLPPVNRRPAPDMPYQQMNRQGPGTVHAPQPRMQYTPGVYQKDEPSQQQQQVEKIEGPPTYSPSPYFIGFLVTILILLGPEGFVAVGAFIIALVLVLSFGKRDKDHAGLSPKRF
ncbi:hypothetical protein TRFO_36470 [Tritrichomonas foetus]|uniref:Uncharacterized protein n=1 Tax=Tritrichomonas foetus TaxID=1144522 RepID=A0A1J4JIH3_9EUKA|nr:hypothetical protein TRFO_36470 [Tritrichomonas foetus]|eukprot:OHS97347.1 hypothetical protein TRFO_36470 [Tritrichomonas foetus]